MNEDDEMVEGEMVDLDEHMSEVEDTPDGGAVIRLEDEQDFANNLDHFANIVDEVDPELLSEAVNDLLDKIDRDKEAREKRDKQYEEGLRRTGLGDDAPGGAQFSGANKVVHPMLIEACVDFSARFMKEIFPSGGPVKAKVLGEHDEEKLEKAERKSEFMNWQTTEQMQEFRGELEQLSTQLPLGGGQYMKMMWNARNRRPVSEFIPIDDIYLPFAATNFYTAERKTHVQYVTKMEFDRRVKSGMYRDVEIGNPADIEFSKASIANDKIEGRKELSYNEDGLRTIFEIYTCIDFGDGVEPYILSVDKSSGLALSLYRNWEPDDDMRRELDWIVEFPFVPWRGAYPIGLTHMIGGLSGAATGALRALLDSAHIQNVPTLLKLKGGPGGQTINVQPTEVVEMEGGALVDDVRKIAMPLPFNGPSPVLFQLLGFLVDAGKGIVQTTFEKLADQNPNQPVGTTMALIEQGMVVFSSIHSRLHSSMARCLKILHRINSAYLTQEDVQAQVAGLKIEPSDFDGPMDVIPVSDPSIFSDTQRFAQTQAIVQRAAMLPQLYDIRKVEEMFLRNLKVPAAEVLLPKPGDEDKDPVSENIEATMGQPIFVLPKQDHLQHIMTHMAFLKSNLFGANPAIIKTYLFPMATHLRDHLLNYYMVEAHQAVMNAKKQGVIQDDPTQKTQIIMQVQQFIEQQLAGFGEELAQIAEQAQQFAPPAGPPMPPDSSLQVAQLNAQVQQAALQQRSQSDQAKMQQQAQLSQQKLQLDQAKLQQDAQLRQADIQAKQQGAALEIQKEQMREQAEDRRTMQELAVRQAMNSADNRTALQLAEQEMLSNERFSVSTGTGVNPNP
jgi:hypothetical protein